jgi:tetratricopeptide (TPR) repeat protein
LVVEDLHWADQSTRDLLAFLVRNLRRNRVLLVATYRSDEPRSDQLRPWLAELDRGGSVQRIELLRLDQIQTAAQLTGILGVVPAADLVSDVFARSEGNPFFTEELLERTRAGSATLPTTMRDLLQGRIEALSEPAQQILRVAAVAGRQVPHPLLVAVAGLDEGPLNGALREAVARQLLVIVEDGFQFRHALLREVVDAGLLPGERARLHAAYAHALTERPELSAGSPAVATAELAIHWDAAREPIRALPARVEAGLAAEGARAFAEAASHYQRALELWQRVADPGRPAGLDRVDLLIRASDATAFVGAVEPAVGMLEDALGRVDPATEPARAAVLLAHLGDHRRVTGDEAGALAAYQAAERLAAATPPSAERARVFAAHAYALTQSHRAQEGLARCEEAIATARAVEAQTEEAKALRVLATCLIELGNLDRGITVGLEARRLAQAVADAETTIGTYMVVSVGLALAGRERDAVEDAQQGYQYACELGLERALGSYVAVNLAQGFLDTGRWSDCERLTRELLAGDSWDASGLHGVLGILLTRRGQFDAARKQLNLALQLSPPFLGR